MDSQMEDTPANYNQANQRFDGGGDPNSASFDDEYGMHQGPNAGSEDDDEEMQDGSGGEGGQSRQKRHKKKKNKTSTVEVLQPTGREKNMAGAYGG